MQDKREREQKMLSVRIPADLFRAVRIQAATREQAVQVWVRAALERALAAKGAPRA